MRRILLPLVIWLAACGEPPHDSPYDPQTPADRQAHTSFSGTVSLEPVGGVSPSLAGIQVSVAGRGYAATTDGTGAYVIEGVPPGTYTVQAVLAGYQTAAVAGVTATLDTGGATVAVPALELRRVRASLAGTAAEPPRARAARACARTGWRRPRPAWTRPARPPSPSARPSPTAPARS